MIATSEKLANVLLVDDSLPEIRLAQETLEQDHVHLNLFAVRDGIEAIKYLHQRNGFANAVHVDLILLDLNMPNMDGKEVLAAIRDDRKLNAIPIVIFSGSDASNEVEETKALGAVDYIVKPLSFEKLQDAVKLIKHLVFEQADDEKYLYRMEA